MRNPFEVLADLYDYQYQYYRMYLSRRLLFSEITPDSFIKSTLSYNIFSNKDYENINKLVPKSTLLGLSLGKRKLAALFICLNLIYLFFK